MHSVHLLSLLITTHRSFPPPAECPPPSPSSLTIPPLCSCTGASQRLFPVDLASSCRLFYFHTNLNYFCPLGSLVRLLSQNLSCPNPVVLMCSYSLEEEISFLFHVILKELCEVQTSGIISGMFLIRKQLRDLSENSQV